MAETRTNSGDAVAAKAPPEPESGAESGAGAREGNGAGPSRRGLLAAGGATLAFVVLSYLAVLAAGFSLGRASESPSATDRSPSEPSVVEGALLWQAQETKAAVLEMDRIWMQSPPDRRATPDRPSQ